MEPDLFSAPQTPEAQVDPQKDYLAELVGEGKKFNDVNSLAKGKAEADLYIERLKGELAGLREDLEKRARLGDLIDKLENRGQPATHVEQREPTPEPKADAALTPDKLTEMVENLLRQRETKTQAQRNLDTVKQAVQAQYGVNYVEPLQRKAAELGLSPAQMNDLAAQSPTALLRLIGVSDAGARTTEFTPPRSSVSNFEPASSVRNQSHYDKLRQTDPTKYWSPAIQNQLHKDALSLGEKFFT